MQIETCKRISAAVPVTSNKRWPRLKASFSFSTGKNRVGVVVVVVAWIITSVASIQPQVTGCIRDGSWKRPRTDKLSSSPTPYDVSSPPPFPPAACNGPDRRTVSRSARSNVSDRYFYSGKKKSNHGTRSPLRPLNDSSPPHSPRLPPTRLDEGTDLHRRCGC